MLIYTENTKNATFGDYFHISTGDIIQVVGSGGKSSFINCIANENKNKNVAIITSTKIEMPANKKYVLKADQKLNINKNTHGIITVGTYYNEDKIEWPGTNNYQLLKKWADIILIEADGSKKQPLKICASYEPVYIKDATKTFIVSGLSALYKPTNKVCHRHELLPNITKNYCKNNNVDTQLISELININYLNSKPINPYIILNQANNDKLIKSGKKILKSLNCDGAITNLQKQT